MSQSNIIANQMKMDIASAFKSAIVCNDQQAEFLACKVFKKIQESFGGQDIYIKAKESEQRNKEILAAFTGRNHAEVCQQFRISYSTLKRIIKNR